MVYTTLAHKQQPPRRRATWMAIVAVVMVVLLLVIFSGLYYTNHLPFWRRTVPTHATGSPYTKGEPATPPPSSSDTTKDGGGTSSSAGSTGQATPSPSPAPPITGDLVAPWGTFANVYSAKSGDQMQSTCNTTPGATCQIIFTNGALTKSLDAETTDAGGAVYWGWTPGQIGLTPGTWHITAKATLGSQTKTTSNDPLTLEVHS